MFASEYHWSKEEILNLYIDELPCFYDVIAKRRDMEFKHDLNLQMQASAYPHMDKAGQKELREAVKIIKKEKLTPEQEREALLKLKSMVK